MDAYLAEQAKRSSVKSFDAYRAGWRGGGGGGGGGESSARPAGVAQGGDDGPPAEYLRRVGAADSDDEGEEGEVEGHPFFDVLRAPPKEAEWDAETILTTYTTTDNHPKMLRVPKDKQIRLHPKSGLPVGVELPGSTAARDAAAAADASAAAGSDDDACEEAPGVNLGAARPQDESAAAKRERKQAAREEKAARRQQKKETKLAFKEERSAQLSTLHATKQIAATPLSTPLTTPGGR